MSGRTWRDANAITDWEFAEIGVLLCDHEPRDLALMIIRLQGRIEAAEMLVGRRGVVKRIGKADGHG